MQQIIRPIMLQIFTDAGVDVVIGTHPHVIQPKLSGMTEKTETRRWLFIL